jgi:hypothetical protein
MKNGRQIWPRQANKHPVKPVAGLDPITEKDNGRMNGDNCLQAFNAYRLRVET